MSLDLDLFALYKVHSLSTGEVATVQGKPAIDLVAWDAQAIAAKLNKTTSETWAYSKQEAPTEDVKLPPFRLTKGHPEW